MSRPFSSALQHVTLPANVTAKIGEHGVTIIAAAIRHVRTLCDVNRDWGAVQRAGAFATDLRRGFQEYRYGDSKHGAIYEQLSKELAVSMLWSDAAVLRYGDIAPAAAVTQLKLWIERAQRMAEPTFADNIKSRLDYVQSGVTGLAALVLQMREHNTAAAALSGQIAAALEGDTVVDPSTKLGPHAFVTTNLGL